jgi:hypothetical protein
MEKGLKLDPSLMPNKIANFFLIFILRKKELPKIWKAQLTAWQGPSGFQKFP